MCSMHSALSSAWAMNKHQSVSVSVHAPAQCCYMCNKIAGKS